MGSLFLYLYIIIVSMNAYLLHLMLILVGIFIVILNVINAAIWLGYYCLNIHTYLYMLILLHPDVNTPPRARASRSRVCSHPHQSLALDLS